jgi:hypothetical protein
MKGPMTTNVFDEVQPQTLNEHLERSAAVVKIWQTMFPEFGVPEATIMQWVLTYPDPLILKAFRRTRSKASRFEFSQDAVERYAASIMRHEVKNEHQFLASPNTGDLLNVPNTQTAKRFGCLGMEKSEN